MIITEAPRDTYDYCWYLQTEVVYILVVDATAIAISSETNMTILGTCILGWYLKEYHCS